MVNLSAKKPTLEDLLLQSLLLKNTTEMPGGTEKEAAEKINEHERSCARLLALGLKKFFSGKLDHYFLAAKSQLPDAKEIYSRAKDEFSERRKALKKKLRSELKDGAIAIAFSETLLPEALTTGLLNIWGEARSNLKNAKAQSTVILDPKTGTERDVMVIRLIDFGGSGHLDEREEFLARTVFLAVDFMKIFMSFGPLQPVKHTRSSDDYGYTPA